jgi:hypothetical protein
MRINPNSSIRSGYAFEDLFVVKLLFDWLQSPESYKAIRVQHIPDEINNNKFYLDDVIAVDKTNCYHLYQWAVSRGIPSETGFYLHCRIRYANIRENGAFVSESRIF